MYSVYGERRRRRQELVARDVAEMSLRVVGLQAQYRLGVRGSLCGGCGCKLMSMLMSNGGGAGVDWARVAIALRSTNRKRPRTGKMVGRKNKRDTTKKLTDGWACSAWATTEEAYPCKACTTADCVTGYTRCI